MKEKFNDLDEKVGTETGIKILLQIIDEQKQTVNEMNGKNSVFESEITHLKRNLALIPNNSNVRYAYELMELICQKMFRWNQG